GVADQSRRQVEGKRVVVGDDLALHLEVAELLRQLVVHVRIQFAPGAPGEAGGLVLLPGGPAAGEVARLEEEGAQDAAVLLALVQAEDVEAELAADDAAVAQPGGQVLEGPDRV